MCISQTIFNSYKKRHPNTTAVNGLVTNGVSRSVNALTTWMMPPFIKRISAKYSFFIGGLLVVINTALYFVPNAYAIYIF